MKRRKLLRLGDTKEERDKRGESYFPKEARLFEKMLPNSREPIRIEPVDVSNFHRNWNVVWTNFGEWLVIAIFNEIIRNLFVEAMIMIYLIDRLFF